MATTFNQPQLSREGRTDLLSRWLARAVTINWEVVVYTAIFVVAVFTRFSGLGDRVMSHDESLHTQFSYYLYRDGNFRHDPLMHGPILFHVTAFFYFLFGDNDFVARLYPAILGVLMVMFPLLFRRWLGRWGAILASVMILASPLLMYYHRYIREDTPSIFASLVMVYCTFMYLDGPERWKRKPIFLYVFSGALLWSLGSKEVAFMYVAIFGLFMTMYWVMRLYQHFFKVPARTLFYTIILAFLIAGAAAMIMYAVLAIAFYGVDVSERLNAISTGLGAILTGQPVSVEFNSFLTWTLLTVGLFVTALVGTMLYVWVRRGREGRILLLDIVIILALATALCLVLIVVEERTFVEADEPEVAALVTPNIPVPATVDDAGNPLPTVRIAINEVGALFGTVINNLPILAAWVFAFLVIGLLVYSRRAGWWRTLYRFPELDILILMGTFILPWLTPVLIKLVGANPTDTSADGIRVAVASVIPMLMISTAVGLTWHWRRWLVSAAVFYILFAFFFTTMFSNPNGLATGMIGSLGYWLNQQGDRRGSQPQYYYSGIIMPMYEFLPMIGSFLAMLAGLVFFWHYRTNRINAAQAERQVESITTPEGEEVPSLAAVTEAPPRTISQFGPDRLRRMSFLLFVAFWGVFNFIAYTFAGEKMPWLATHITVPLIFLTAWYFGRVFQGIDWQKFTQRGWLYLLLLPVLGAALLQLITPYLNGQAAFTGLEQGQLQNTTNWLAMLFVAGFMIYLIRRVAQHTGFLQLRRMIGVAAFAVLSLITFRAAWMASFINYDYATEFLVYAHGAPGIKTMMQQIEEISRRTTDGMNLRFAWGGNAWPVTWYFRDLTNVTYFRENPTLQQVEDAVAIYASADIRSRVEPLLEDRYYRFEYQRMWWPDQEYFYLDAPRVLNAFNLSGTALTDLGQTAESAQIRQGIWDIWWSRDYTQYGIAAGRGDTHYSYSNWPVAERMYFYVRKDIAAQVWDMGTGGTTALNTLADASAPSVCTTNYQPLLAFSTYQNQAEGSPNNLSHPLDLAVDAERNLYVADEFNNRVVVFDQTGQVVRQYGSSAESPLLLTRPNGIDLGADGNVYIADTWAYRVQVAAPDGTLLSAWGQPGQYGIEAQTEPVDGLWGPRDIVTDPEGRVYIADTGNKRVRVYTASGEFIRDIGTGGSAPGQLDEPAGMTVSPDGRLFVADTWNRRISVFSTADGSPLYQFNVLGWYEDLGNRPYVAVDPLRDLLYVGDPDAARVLVYTTNGTCIGSFGQKGDPTLPMDGSSFGVISGITLDADGNVYIADSAANRVLAFAPFPLETSPNADPGVLERLLSVDVVEVTVETAATEQTVTDDPTSTSEITPETTASANG
ncbi:MAG: TIGR03663 family protein [bacterium]|nr:TIGR03663 family protein [bacterium]